MSYRFFIGAQATRLILPVDVAPDFDEVANAVPIDIPNPEWLSPTTAALDITAAKGLEIPCDRRTSQRIPTEILPRQGLAGLSGFAVPAVLLHLGTQPGSRRAGL